MIEDARRNNGEGVPPPRGAAADWARVIRRADAQGPVEAPAIVAEARPESAHSPLTDPRAVGSSLLFHVALLAIASIAALSVRAPAEPEGTVTALRGELGPVDTRAKDESGGGGPGELGGMDRVRLTADGQSPQSQALKDPTADALLSEMLPAPSSPDASQRALPGPLTTGLGILPGPGLGGGGGSGGGSGGGVGRGIGPGTEFFGAREQARSFAYVIDCSGSMAVHKALDVAKLELLNSLGQLPPDARFGVVFYNLNSTIFPDARGQPGLMPATAANKGRVRALMSTVVPDGGTNHMTALRSALDLRPEVIFFLTDADLMTKKDVEEVLAQAGNTRIQAIEFGLGPNVTDSAPLRKLAASTGGTYRYKDITKFDVAKFGRPGG